MTLYSLSPGDDVDSFSRASEATYYGHPPDMVPEDVDYYNDFRNGDPRPTLGPGLPEFSRAGTRWVWDGEHFVEIAGDIERFSPRDVPGGKVRRMLELALAATGKVPDSVDFSSGSGWSRQNVGSEAQVLSAFEGLPTGGEARKVVGSGSGTGLIQQNAGSSTSAKECTVSVWEDDGSGGTVGSVVDDDTGEYINVLYDFAAGSASENTGTVVAIVLSENGENGGRMVLLIGIGTGNGATGRQVDYRFDRAGTGKGAILHYADHFEHAFPPGVQPAVGSPVAMPAEQFHVSPGPYRSDEVQVGYLAFEAGTLVGQTGGNRHIVEQGDGSTPKIAVLEPTGTAGEYRFFFSDGTNSINRAVNVGSSTPGQRVEIIYVYDPQTGRGRILARADGGSWVQSGVGEPSSWTTPTSFGADNRIVHNELGDLNGSRRGRQFYERHFVTRQRRLHNNPFYGAAEDVGAEIAGIFVAPDGSRVVSTGV